MRNSQVSAARVWRLPGGCRDGLARLAALVFLMAAAFLLYASSLRNGFTGDDMSLVVHNTFIKHLKYLPSILTHKMSYFAQGDTVDYYRPVQILSYALDYSVGKLNPFGYHLINIALHGFCAYLLFRLVELLFGRRNLAFVCSLLFVMHPIHSSAVNYIACRDTFFVSMFGLLCLICYAKSLSRGKRAYFAASLLFFLLSLFSKESALLLPLLVALCAALGHEPRPSVIKKLSFFAGIIAAYLFIRYGLLGLGFSVVTHNFRLTAAGEIVNFTHLVFCYGALLLAPLNLRCMHMAEFILLPYYYSLLVAVFIGAGVYGIWRVVRKNEVVWFGLAWFALSFLFLFRTMYLKPNYGASMSEWWAYFPSVGIFIILAEALCTLARKSRIIFIVAVGALCVFWACVTFYNNAFWKDEPTLYRRDLAIDPLNNDMRINLANVYVERADFQAAMEEFSKALSQEPWRWEAFLGAGDILFKQGNYEHARNRYFQALKVNPSCARAWLMIGHCYISGQQFDQAQDAWSRAIQVSPYSQDALNAMYNLGNLYANKGDLPKALSVWNEGLRLDPGNSALQQNVRIAEKLMRR